MKLIDDKSINVVDMQDGEIAVITAWVFDRYVGRIVQRYEYNLVALGSESGNSWPGHFNSTSNHEGCKVKILPKGTRLEI